MSSSNKPTECDVLSQCTPLTNIEVDTTTYKIVKRASNDNENEDSSNLDTTTTTTPGLGIQNNSFLRIVPMDRKYGGWSTEHFHPDFKINTDDKNGLLVLFQGMAKECIAVAISPQPQYILGKTYAIHIGASGNQFTIIRRHITGDKCVEASFFTPHVCSLKRYLSYWIYVQPKEGLIEVGVGNEPGKKCIAKLDDSSESLFDRGSSTGDGTGDGSYYVGFGNSALLKYSTGHQSESQCVKIRRLYVLSASLQSEEVRPFQTIHERPQETAPLVIDEELKKEYNAECEKAKLRAEKFNIEFKGLPPIEEYYMKKEYNKQYEKAKLRAEKFGVEFKGLPPIKEYFKNTYSNMDTNDGNGSNVASRKQPKRSFSDDMQDFRKRGHDKKFSNTAPKKRKTNIEYRHDNKNFNNKRRKKDTQRKNKKNNQDDNGDIDEEELLNSELKSKRTSGNKDSNYEDA